MGAHARRTLGRGRSETPQWTWYVSRTTRDVSNDVRAPILRSARLRLEPMNRAHVAPLLAYRLGNRTHLAPWKPTPRPDAFSETAVATEIERSVAAASNGQNVRFVVFEDEGEEIVGEGVWQSAILGYSIDVVRQGRGYATEGAARVIAYAFDELNLHRLQTSYQPTNERSGRVLRKLGFVVEGYARDYLFLNDAWRDGILVSLTNPHWRPD